MCCSKFNSCLHGNGCLTSFKCLNDIPENAELEKRVTFQRKRVSKQMDSIDDLQIKLDKAEQRKNGCFNLIICLLLFCSFNLFEYSAIICFS